MTNLNEEQNLPGFLREHLGPTPAAPRDLEDRIWKRTRPRPRSKWLAAAGVPLLAAAAAAIFAVWPVEKPPANDDAELEAFVESIWDGTFDEANDTYDLASSDE